MILRYTANMQKLFKAKTKPESWLHIGFKQTHRDGGYFVIFVWDTRQAIEEGKASAVDITTNAKQVGKKARKLMITANCLGVPRKALTIRYLTRSISGVIFQNVTNQIGGNRLCNLNQISKYHAKAADNLQPLIII